MESSTGFISYKALYSCTVLVASVLEKLCKAHWVKDNTANHPPKIHNLVVIIKATKMKLTEEQVACMALMNDFQLEGRYPDYKDKLYKRCNNAYTKHILEQANNLRLCLLREVQ